MTDTLCVCGHAAEPHQHHRDRRDCSRCGRELCREFRPLTWWRRVLNRVGWYPAPLPDPVPAVDLTSLFTPARFQVVERVAAWHAGAERALSPEQWAAAARDVDAAALWFAEGGTLPPLVDSDSVPVLLSPGGPFSPSLVDADGRRIEVGDWVQILEVGRPFGRLGEVMDMVGSFVEVRTPPAEVARAVLCENVRVIRWEES